MADILKIKVRVKIKMSVFSTYTDNKHHGISTDILARKWGIGIDKAKRTIQSTIQNNVRPDMKPLTQRYIKLSQRLRQLDCIFYTYKLFAKDKSIVGNTCAQIFTDGYFFQIIPMITKPESGTT